MGIVKKEEEFLYMSFPQKRIIVIGKKGKPFETIHIEKRQNIPIWQTIKNFINSLKVDQQFSRKDIINTVYKKKIATYIVDPASIDFYRNLLTRLEYIETIKPGIYIKKDNIPKNAPISLIRKFASNKQAWKEWFMPAEERRKQIKEICELERKQKLSRKLKVKKKDL